MEFSSGFGGDAAPAVAPVDLDYRRALHHDNLLQHVPGAAQPGPVDGGLDRVATHGHGPFFAKEKIRPRHGGHELGIVVPGERVSQGYAGGAKDGSEGAAGSENSGARGIVGLEEF